MIRVNAPEGIALWQLELDGAIPLPCLSPDEQERANRFRFARDRHRYVACRSALRILLADALGVAPEAVAFTYGPQGKPACTIPFNVSHSDGLALLALGADGVDIERIRPGIDPEALGRSVFTATERAAIKTVEDFFFAWTAKEALIKAEGGGFSSPLLQRTVWPTLEPDLAERFQIARITTESGFAAALAIRKVS